MRRSEETETPVAKEIGLRRRREGHIPEEAGKDRFRLPARRPDVARAGGEDSRLEASEESRDRLLPRFFSAVHPRFRTPHLSTILTGSVVAIAAGLLPIGVLSELVSIGSLLAFVLVCVGVIVLRRTDPETPRPFRVPAAWFTCVAGVVVCLGMTAFLPHDTWVRLLIWTALGFTVYFLYGYRHSRQRPQAR